MDATLRYTWLGFQVTALLDEGDVLDIDDTRKHALDETLFSWLKDRFGGRIDLSLYEAADRAEVSERFASLANAVDSRRKFGVERNGLALLGAYSFEMVQELHLSSDQ
jgi:hypothetical protein